MPVQVYVASTSALVAGALVLGLRSVLVRSGSKAAFSLPLAFGAAWGLLVLIGLVATLVPGSLLPLVMGGSLIGNGLFLWLRGRQVEARFPGHPDPTARLRAVWVGLSVVAGSLLVVLAVSGAMSA